MLKAFLILALCLSGFGFTKESPDKILDIRGLVKIDGKLVSSSSKINLKVGTSFQTVSQDGYVDAEFSGFRFHFLHGNFSIEKQRIISKKKKKIQGKRQSFYIGKGLLYLSVPNLEPGDNIRISSNICVVIIKGKVFIAPTELSIEISKTKKGLKSCRVAIFKGSATTRKSMVKKKKKVLMAGQYIHYVERTKTKPPANTSAIDKAEFNEIFGLLKSYNRKK